MNNPYMGEFRRYQKILTGALEQIGDQDFFKTIRPTDNSIAIILKHISGNLKSRFTDFLTTDGEKEWRDRDSEFIISNESHQHLYKKWNQAWKLLEKQVSAISIEQYQTKIKIRGIELTVEEALCRSLSHFSYHVGEITFIAKHLLGQNWEFQSVLPGKSKEYNKNPTREKIV